MTAAATLPPPAVDEAAQGLKDAGEPVNLVEDHQMVLVLLQVEFRFVQLGAVRGQFQVKVKSLLSRLLRQGQGNCCLAHLSRPEDGHGGKLLEELAHVPLDLTLDDHIAIMPHHGMIAMLGKLASNSWRV